MEIRPVHHLDATVEVPGSKSYTQRALIIAALAEGRSTISRVLLSEDTRYLMEALRVLGIEILTSGNDVIIQGTGGKIRNPGQAIYLGNNGTALRFLTTMVSLGKGEFLLEGSSRLRERPLKPLLDALKTLGVPSHSRDNKGYPPVRIDAQGLRGGSVVFTDVESSQYISSLLIGAPYAAEDIEITLQGSTVSEPYIEMTLHIMERFGAEIERGDKNRFKVKSGRNYAGQEYIVEGDASSASYFFLAAALCRGRVKVMNINPESLQGDIKFLNIMEGVGCSIVRGDSWVDVIGGPLHGGDVVFDMGNMPDMVPTLAVLAAFRQGRTSITNVSHLRLKESDRIAALVNELHRIGVNAKERDDGLVIEGGKPHGADIETYNDHRIAMSFAIAGLAVPKMKIQDKLCVGKSFPGFWDELKKLYGRA
ncbi:MAG: 3-phosphoshikimate 1-carboxyvinyltransferase [Deltaproteobacteria bacterium]|nr:3-phosphoshikimate 1-carboxyvinyltransferase [Deltaproteobacteria bacterium]